VLELDLDPRVVQAWADPNRLKQVLFNYLSNALKFTPEAGRVTIRTFAVDEQRFELEVEDSGVGIKAEDIGKLFSEFHQVRSSTGDFHAGTGLGLREHIPAWAYLPFVVLIFAVEVWLSRWWLARHRFGPMEWLWRTMTYGHPPRASVSDVSV